MSTTTIKAAWESKIWANDAVSELTDKIHNHEITDASEYEIEKLSYGGEINFFEWIIERTLAPGEIGSGKHSQRVTVSIRYTRQKDTDGTNFGEVQSAIETMQELVQTELGLDWDGTIDFFSYQDGPATITTETIQEVECWRGVYSFIGQGQADF